MEGYPFRTAIRTTPLASGIAQGPVRAIPEAEGVVLIQRCQPLLAFLQTVDTLR